MKKILGLILISIFMSISAKAEWQSMVPSGNVTSTLVKNNTIFATCMGQGVFRSENEGVSWTQLNNGLTSTIVTSSCSNDNYIYIGTFDGVYRSDNNGDNWQKCNNGIIDNLHIKSICAIDSFLCVLTDSNGVYASIDNGNSWKIKHDGIEFHEFVYVIELKDMKRFGSNFLLMSYDSVFVLNAYDREWESFDYSFSEPIKRVFGTCTYKGINLIATYRNGLPKIYADINGYNLFDISKGLDSTQAITSLTTSKDSIYAITEYGMLYSLYIPNKELVISDYQNYEWKYVNDFLHNPYPFQGYSNLNFLNDTYFAGTTSNLYKGKLGVIESDIVSNGLKINRIYYIVSVQNSLFGCSYPGDLYKSSNNAVSWDKINIPLDSNFLCFICYSDKTNLYAIIKNKHNYEYFTMKSIDCGQNWERIGSSYYDVRDIFMSSDEILIANKEGLFRMDTDGNNQAQLNYQTSIDAIKSIYKTQNMIFVVTDFGKIYKGINSGTEWIKIDTNFNDCTENYKCRTTKVRAIDNVLFAASGEKLLKSEDWGKTWTVITPQLPKLTIYNIEVIDNFLYITCTSDKYGQILSDVIFSKDYGNSWTFDYKGIGVGGGGEIYVNNELIFYAAANSTIAFKQKPGNSNAPKLMYPVNNSDKIDLNDRLIWCKIDGVKKYEVNISKNSDFSNGKLQTIDNVTIETEMYYVDKLQLDKNAKYYWRVRGIGDGINTEWSETSSFTTGETSDIFDNFKEYFISIAPQPADNEAFITFHNSNNTNELNVEIYDIKGTLLDNVNFNSLLNGMNNLRLDISKLATGFYNVIIKSDSKTYHTKLIKK